MKWKKLSDYAIQSGQYTISKAYLDGAAKYTLWEGDVMRGIFESAEEAKRQARSENGVENV